MSSKLRIVNLYAENFKRLKCVDITPDGDMVPIVGLNEQGKTSVLDAISAALQWRAVSKGITQPVHGDEQKGQTVIDLGEYVVTRTFNASGTTNLKVTNRAGDPLKKPQQILDGLMGDLSFDPLEFSRKKPEEQRELIARLLKQTAGLDISSFEARYREDYDKRTTLRRDLKKLVGQRDGIAAPTDGDPAEETDITELTCRISDRVSLIQQYDELETKVVRAQERVAELERELSQAEAEKIALEAQLAKMSCPAPVGELQDEVENLEATNRRAREVIQYNTLNGEIEELESEIEKCGARMQLALIEKDEAIEAADLPIEGLGITEDGITVNDIPFSQCSGAQRLKVSMAIAMQANPTVRVILIRDGSLLDADNMEVIREMAGEHDFQLWVERVSEDGEVGVLIEDGEVAN